MPSHHMALPSGPILQLLKQLRGGAVSGVHASPRAVSKGPPSTRPLSAVGHTCVGPNGTCSPSRLKKPSVDCGTKRKAREGIISTCALSTWEPVSSAKRNFTRAIRGALLLTTIKYQMPSCSCAFGAGHVSYEPQEMLLPQNTVSSSSMPM